MTKPQKIWMWIFIATFALPEILWGNLIKILRVSFLPIYRNVQYFTDTPVVAFLVITIEVVSILGVFYLLNKKDEEINIILRSILNIVLVAIFLALIISLYLSYVMTQVSFF